MTDYSVAQCETQRLEIACLKREVERLRAELDEIANLTQSPTASRIAKASRAAGGRIRGE